MYNRKLVGLDLHITEGRSRYHRGKTAVLLCVHLLIDIDVKGILPPVALAVLMMLLPIVLRLLAKFEGIPQHSGLELSLMTRYFIFQVVVRQVNLSMSVISQSQF